MKNLFQAIRMALKYKYSLISSIICSVMVAVLWGANITAVYPFVEVVFQGKTLHDWVDHQIESVEKDIVKAQHSRADHANNTTVIRNINQQRAIPPALDKRLHTLKRSKAWIDRFAPNDPFQTLLAIVGFLVIGTFIKSAFRIGSLVLVGCAAGRTTADLRNQFFRSLLSDRPARNQAAGDAAARVGGDMGAIGTAVQTLFGRSIQEPLKMGACLVVPRRLTGDC